MLDMIYINDKTKSLVHFTLEGKSFVDLYIEVNDRKTVVKKIGEYFESIIMEFGQTLDIPQKLLGALKEKDLDDLLLKLHTAPEYLFTENFFAIIPHHMMRNFTDIETLRIYRSLGVNQYAVLIKSEDKKTTHLAAADFEEFRERFVLIEEGI